MDLTSDVQTRDDKRYQGRRQYDNELVTHLDAGAREREA